MSVESVAETAARCGIPPDKLTNLLEHPKVCELLVTARDNPELRVEQIAVSMDLPTCDPDGLDFDILERELAELRALATRSSGDQGPIEQRMDYPIIRGKLDRAEARAEKYRDAIDRALALLRDVGGKPQHIGDSVNILATARMGDDE